MQENREGLLDNRLNSVSAPCLVRLHSCERRKLQRSRYDGSEACVVAKGCGGDYVNERKVSVLTPSLYVGQAEVGHVLTGASNFRSKCCDEYLMPISTAIRAGTSTCS
jgi:hypothetical protein